MKVSGAVQIDQLKNLSWTSLKFSRPFGTKFVNPDFSNTLFSPLGTFFPMAHSSSILRLRPKAVPFIERLFPQLSTRLICRLHAGLFSRGQQNTNRHTLRGLSNLG